MTAFWTYLLTYALKSVTLKDMSEVSVPQDPYVTPQDNQTQTVEITENSPSSNSKGARFSFKWIAVTLVAVVLLGGVGSVVYMIGQTAQTYSKATEKQNKQITKLLNETNNPSSSFGLVSKVEARENPFDEKTQYSNPINTVPNPFDGIE